MDKISLSVLINSINTIYPKSINSSDPATMELWYRLIGDLDYGVASTALQKYMMLNRFPPKPSDIRDAVGTIRSDTEDWSEAYEKSKRAIRRYGYMREEEGLASLPTATRETVRRLGWMTLCTATAEEEAANRANFRMIYTSIAEKNKQEASMPESLRTAINGIRAESIGTTKEEKAVLISKQEPDDRSTPEYIDKLMGEFRNRGINA